MNDAAARAELSLRERYEQELRRRGFEADAAQRSVVTRLEALRARVLAHPPPKPWTVWIRRLFPQREGVREPRGLYLWGGVGRGKTWLMDLFCDSLPTVRRERTHFHHFMRDVHAKLRALQARRSPLEIVARQIARDTQLLCLDELFVADIADAMILGTLFEALLRYGVYLVITSNSAPRDLYRDGLQRSRFLPAIDLLEHELEVVSLDGGIDYRLRALRRRPIYLDSRSSDATAQLQQLFDSLAGESGESARTLRIGGRVLPVRRRRGGVVWFEFAVLCEGPRSQNDYVEIAQEFCSVLLSDVPVFDSEVQDNAARRFIALVDELYDQGVKLIVSAAAPPADLYRGERLQFEFRRAASRLIEMQTEAYLARPHRSGAGYDAGRSLDATIQP